MMTLTEEQFFWLMRAGLWGREETEFPMIAPCFIEWPSLLGLAKRQTTLLVVQDGIEYLIARQKQNEEELVSIPPRALLKVQNFRMQTLTVHQELGRMIQEVDALLRGVGIVPVLLKGESMAALYRKPESRSCGDIDLYVHPQDYDRASILMGSRYELTEKGTTEKHETFQSGRYKIELHWSPLSLQRPLLRRRFDRYSLDELAGGTPSLTLPFTGASVAVPPVTYNAVFLLGHLFHHFIEGGVGLRQICDWTLFVARYEPQMDRNRLQVLLRRFGLFTAWQVFGLLAVRYLGIPSARMPFYTERLSAKADAVVSIILREGNFGRYGKGKYARRQEDSYSMKKSKAMRLSLNRMFRKARIFPIDVLLYFPSWLWESLGRLLRRR